MNYEYTSCDGNASLRDDESDFHPMTCNLCEHVFNYDCGSRSKLNAEWYCDQCKEIVIEQDEKDYPGDKGNHKSLNDFEI